MKTVREAPRSNTVAYAALILAVLGITTSFMSFGGAANNPQVNYPLGTWVNMPSTSTELMGNTSYRQTYFVGSTAPVIQASLAVSCINPSNTAGANLQLQYANFSTITNTAGSFANLGSTILIDNSANNACPGNLMVSTATNMPQGTGSVIFRVMGAGGGGTGDNPRFSAITVSLGELVNRLFLVVISSISATTFGAIVYSQFAVAGAQIVKFQWTAMNVTGATCITLSNCFEHGQAQCTIAITANSCSVTTTYPNAFSAAPNVVATINSPVTQIALPLGTISLLSAQTLTV